MIINITNTRQLSVAEIEEFIKAPKPISFSAVERKEAYKWIEMALVSLKYKTLKRHEKGIVKKYLKIMTSYCDAQIDNLVCQYQQSGHIRNATYKREKFSSIYTRQDILLMAETDKLFRVLSGPAMKVIYKREYEDFGNIEFNKLSEISISHIYNLRGHFVYKNIIKIYHHTKPVTVPIGLRRKPTPNGRPGYIRVDTVHQGDDHELGKSVYHINFVDEVTQWEVVVCVPVISERYLAPALEAMLYLFPFIIFEFHSDNGSEFINKTVAEILNRLHIQQSKSRPRKSNDNGLVETKNNAIIRKEMGYGFIQKGAYKLINNFYQNFYNAYLNYHRPCGFVTVITDKRGKEKKIYRPSDYMMPYEKLKSLPSAEQYLKPGVTFAQLNKIAYKESDVEFAREMREARSTLSVKIKKSYLRDSVLRDY
ncbi:MAG: DDE-type integrase/transposase/recombinase [bacterium]